MTEDKKIMERTWIKCKKTFSELFEFDDGKQTFVNIAKVIKDLSDFCMREVIKESRQSERNLFTKKLHQKIDEAVKNSYRRFKKQFYHTNIVLHKDFKQNRASYNTKFETTFKEVKEEWFFTPQQARDIIKEELKKSIEEMK